MNTNRELLSYEQVVKWYFEAKNSKEYMNTVKADMALRLLKNKYYDRFVVDYPEELI